MAKTLKYSLMIVIVIVLIVGCLLFYLKKDGYLVTFNSNGGSVVAPIKTGLAKTIDKPENPVKEGYHFVGWYLDGEKFDFDTEITENITLQAEYEKQEEVMYTLAFDSLGGDKLENIIVKENTVLEAPIPERDGYEFVGWYYHNKEFDFSNPITSDMVLVAKYKKQEEVKTSVVITFNSNGGSEIASETISVGDLVKMPKEPVRDGYKFAGWYLHEEEFNFTNPVYEDIILDAYWVKE